MGERCGMDPWILVRFAARNTSCPLAPMSPKRRKADRPAPHAGSHHRIYSLKELDPSTNANVYSFQWAEGCKLKSLIEIYLKDGNSLNNTNRMDLSYDSPELEDVRKRVISNYDTYQNKSHDQFVNKLSVIECFCLEFLTQAQFSEYLMKLKNRLIPLGDGKFSGNDNREHIEFSPLNELEVIAFIDYLITPKDNLTPFGVNGRGVGYKSLEGFITVIRTIHRSSGIPEGKCPTCGETVKSMIKDVFDRYHPEGAPILDLATFLPGAYVALHNADIPDLDKLMRWSMLLISINIFARASEMTEYCPLVEDIVYPSDAGDWCSDGLPRYMKIKLKWWKSRKKLQPVEYIIWRNFLDSKYCPMLNLVLWLRASDIKQGPIYAKLRGPANYRECVQAASYVIKRRGCINYNVWVDDNGQEVNITYETWSDICRMFFIGAGVPDATTHSIRKSAAVWAARCGAEDYQIREAGRWNSGDTYMIYVKSGKSIASLAASRNDGSVDIIRKIWVFHPTVYITDII